MRLDRWAAFVAAIFLLASTASAQRVTRKLSLSELDETLRLDVNTVMVASTTVEGASSGGRATSGRTADLNVPPSLVLSPDGNRAFLPIAGSNRVLVFSPRTGEVETFLEVGNNPIQATLTPDGRYVLVVCIEALRNLPESAVKFAGDYVGSLVRIDVATLETVTLEFERVFFSVVNNVVVSPDSSTAYLASAGTDELLRVDIAAMQEAGTRLKLTPGMRPTRILAIPNRNELAVVLVGSSTIDKVKNPDHVALVDLGSFQVVDKLVPPTGPNQEDQFIHDFNAATRPAVSPDGRYLGIADQTISSGSRLEELGGDRFWVFDLETGEVKRYNVGGLAGAVYWAPNDRFLVISALNFNFVDPVTDETEEIWPLFANFRPETRPAFSPDGRFMYLPAPLDDQVIVFDMTYKVVVRAIPVGGGVERNGTTFPSAPLVAALTPGGEHLLVLDYNAGEVEWVSWTEHLAIQRIADDEELFTGVALTNPGSEAASIILTGLRYTGIIPGDDKETEDVVEYVNPREFTLNPGEQIALQAPEWLQTTETQIGDFWFDVDTDRPEVRGFFLLGTRDLRKLDGAVAERTPSQRIVVPEVRVTEDEATELAILNPHRQQVSYSVVLFDDEGKVLGTVANQLASRSSYVGFVRDPDPSDGLTGGLFPESVFQNFTSGYLVVTCSTGAMVTARVQTAEGMGVVRGIPVGDLDPKPTRFVVPQAAMFEGARSVLRLVNSYQRPTAAEGEEEPEIDPETIIEVTVSWRGDTGELLAGPVTLTLEPGQAVREALDSLFSLDPSAGLTTGWLEIVADRPGLVGDLEVELFDGRALTLLDLQPTDATELVFSHVAQGAGVSTGLALVNARSEAANVRIAVFSPAGEATGEVELVLAPGMRTIGLLPDLIPDLAPQLGGYVQVTSDVPLFGLELFFADSLEFVATVGPQ
ncbi:MAG: hypothetical protein Kow00109_03370 [Acidobacteriota bacterium]